MALAGCSASATGSTAGTTARSVPVPPSERYSVVASGRLAAEPDVVRDRHDQLASQGRDAARLKGDISHYIGLGNAQLGSDKLLLLVDEWSSLSGLREFFGQPAIRDSFGLLFADPVAPMVFQQRTDWRSWGELAAGPATGRTYWLIVVRGHLARGSADENRTAHDAMVTQGERIARAAGNIAHIPQISVDDPRVYSSFDVWTDPAAMARVLGDPEMQRAFAGLFDGAPEVHIFQASEWQQWSR
jgi:quinol monooxygenase YgiN